MRFKLTPDLCYFAGLAKGNREAEKSRLGFRTTYEQLAETFIKHAIALGVQPNKMMIEKQETYTYIYFYHSKLSRILHEVYDQREILPKKSIKLAISFAAGMFDSSGHASNGRIFIQRMDKRDALLLALLGINTTGSGRVMNAKSFLEMIKPQSFIAKKILS